jgi:phosphoglycerate dehydrogenase-like enzyme
MSLEKRNVIVAPFPRTMNEIFTERDLKRLASFANVLWAEDHELPDSVLENLLPETWAFVAFSPPMSTERLHLSSQLKAILEVGGHFPATIDYSECFARGVRVLSCAPAFARQVAEMALSMSRWCETLRIRFCHRIGQHQSVASAKRSAEWSLTTWRSWRRGFPPH